MVTDKLSNLFSLRSILGRSLCLCFLCFWSLLCRGLSSSCFSLFRAATATTSLLLSLRSLSHVFIEVYKLDEAHRSCITWTNTKLDDACVASRTVCYASSYLTKEFLDGIALLEITEHDTTRRGGIGL